eukprot:6205999-Pleurochrysis_carterae.AAC.1
MPPPKAMPAYHPNHTSFPPSSCLVSRQVKLCPSAYLSSIHLGSIARAPTMDVICHAGVNAARKCDVR